MSTRPRRWRRRLTILAVAGAALLAGGYAASGKPKPFDPAHVPAAPDYAQAAAWLAFPGRDGLERSVPSGVTAIDEAAAPVDVFFIHPTTYRRNDVLNVAIDLPAEDLPLNAPVQLDQISVFNGCCRLYAPRYRQTSVTGLSDQQAVALAYSDVARAFRRFIAHESKGRPFIVASHSQGTLHAVQLLQREVLGTPLQGRLVAAYLIGGYVPDAFVGLDLPTCDAPAQTGCLVSYNSAKPASRIARNPLTWRVAGAAPASANPGSHPFPEAPFPARAAPLASLVPKLTGAVCRNGMLEVELQGSRDGFRDKLTWLGSYHIMDYGLFYASLRRNAIDRVEAWQARKR